MSKNIEDHTKKEWNESLIHSQADNHRLRNLLKELGSAMSDEVVDKTDGNFIKIKVDDMPEEMISYIK